MLLRSWLRQRSSPFSSNHGIPCVCFGCHYILEGYWQTCCLDWWLFPFVIMFFNFNSWQQLGFPYESYWNVAMTLSLIYCLLSNQQFSSESAAIMTRSKTSGSCWMSCVLIMPFSTAALKKSSPAFVRIITTDQSFRGNHSPRICLILQRYRSMQVLQLGRNVMISLQTWVSLSRLF